MTVAAHAARVAMLCDVLGVPRASLVGHGMGAAIAAVMAHTHPERIAHALLVNPTMIGLLPADVVLSSRIARVAALLPLWRRLPPHWLASTLHTALLPCYAHRDVGARSLDLYLTPFRTAHGRASACAQLNALSASTHDTRAALQPGALRCPILLALAAKDPFLSTARAVRLASQLQDATRSTFHAHELAGVAHVAPEEAPDRLGTLVSALLTS